MVKSETRRDAEILVRNPSPRLFGKKFQNSKKVTTNHAKTRFRDLSKMLPSFRDPAKICRDPRFSRYHSPPLILYLSITAFLYPLNPTHQQVYLLCFNFILGSSLIFLCFKLIIIMHYQTQKCKNRS